MKKKSFARIIALVLAVLLIVGCIGLISFSSFAAEEDAAPDLLVSAEAPDESGSAEPAPADSEGMTTRTKAIVAGAMMAIAATAGAFAMCHAISKGSDGMARQPEASGDIRSNVMLGLVFIETAIIYALIVAILIVFVL